MVDFSTGGHKVDLNDIAKNIVNFPEEGLAIDHFDDLHNLIKKAKSIIYLSDNCGEVVVDNLVVDFLVKELKKKVSPGLLPVVLILSFLKTAVIVAQQREMLSYWQHHTGGKPGRKHLIVVHLCLPVKAFQ